MMDNAGDCKRIVVVVDDDDEYRSITPEERDLELFFNFRSQGADFEYWSKHDAWTHDEANALSRGRNPKRINWKFVYEYTEISPFAKEYQRRRRLFIRAIKCGALPYYIPPKLAITWAKSKGIDFPQALEQLILTKSTAGHIKGERWTDENLVELCRESRRLKERGVPNPTKVLSETYGVSSTIIKRKLAQHCKAGKPNAHTESISSLALSGLTSPSR